MATRGKSARELQEEIDAALRKRQRQLGRGRWHRAAAITAAVAAGLALAGLLGWLVLIALGLNAGI